MKTETFYVDHNYTNLRIKNVPHEKHGSYEDVVDGRVSLFLSVIYEYAKTHNFPFKEIDYHDAFHHKGISELWESYVLKYTQKK